MTNTDTITTPTFAVGDKVYDLYQADPDTYENRDDAGRVVFAAAEVPDVEDLFGVVAFTGKGACEVDYALVRYGTDEEAFYDWVDIDYLAHYVVQPEPTGTS